MPAVLIPPPEIWKGGKPEFLPSSQPESEVGVVIAFKIGELSQLDKLIAYNRLFLMLLPKAGLFIATFSRFTL